MCGQVYAGSSYHSCKVCKTLGHGRLWVVLYGLQQLLHTTALLVDVRSYTALFIALQALEVVQLLLTRTGHRIWGKPAMGAAVGITVLTRDSSAATIASYYQCKLRQ
jgi:hypothetical protein